MSTKEEVVQWLRDVSSGKVVTCYVYEILDKMLSIDTVGNLPQTPETMNFMMDQMDKYGEDLALKADYQKRGVGNYANTVPKYGHYRRKLAEALADKLENSDVG